MIIKKRYKISAYIVLISLVIFVSLASLSAGKKGSAVSVSGGAKAQNLTILLAGLDEAAENTDVLMLVSLNERGEMNILQIPRDTYIKTEEHEGRINQLYPLFVRKYGRKNGADKFSAVVSDAFGVSVDRYAVFSGKDIEQIVDALDGVTVNVPYAFKYPAKNGEERAVPSGEQKLKGEDALAFLRYRALYTEGDLGRLDAQMRFIAALARQAFEKRDLKTYFRIYQKSYRNLLTNLTEKDIINNIQAFLSSKNAEDIRIMRLPGEAFQSKNGAWYYVLNRKSAAEMLYEYFSGSVPPAFDRAKGFLKESEDGFKNIYNARSYEARVYTLSEAERVRVLHK